jgi:hypothetical protein
VTRAPAARLHRTSAIATVLLVLSLVIPAALAPGCDRIVNLTPFYDAQPDLDGHRPDGGFALDAGPGDGSAAPEGGGPDDGMIAPLDGGAFPDTGDAFPDDSNITR